ncbi:DNA-binding protein [Methylobacterium sp. GC_Met_2]|uniref:helix-turn-helix transcriptional regulator n=1 Tax=Methylobacterium sp. GC_Met_2 TaxID=2937376 RepID=UPI00226B4F97|nr:DNA-binding protein [Methylobacterium sp. GC_Met_2]
MRDRQKIYLTGSQVRRRYGGVSQMALWRWVHEGKVDFPKPDMVLNGRHLWEESTLDAFDARQATKMEAA